MTDWTWRHLRLERPLVVLDVETTGTDPRRDRVVEPAAVRFGPDGTAAELQLVLDPGVPIPPEASAVHGLTDADVVGCPRFADVADRVGEFLAGADAAGFHVGFDLRFLHRELAGCGRGVALGSVVDAKAIYHRREPRNLAAAVRIYVGEEHAAAHTALCDAWAAARVLDGQLARYVDLPREVDSLAEVTSEVDLEGRRTRVGGKLVLAFGRHRGRRLCDLAGINPGCLRWMLAQDFLPDVKAWVEKALAWAGAAGVTASGGNRDAKAKTAAGAWERDRHA